MDVSWDAETHPHHTVYRLHSSMWYVGGEKGLRWANIEGMLGGNALRKVGLQNVEELVVELSARTAVGYVQQLANSYLSTKTSASTIINSCKVCFLDQ